MKEWKMSKILGSNCPCATNKYLGFSRGGYGFNGGANDWIACPSGDAGFLLNAEKELLQLDNAVTAAGPRGRLHTSNSSC